MSISNKITPRKLKGFWELMPKEQMLFSSLLDQIETVFERNCFVPLDTPILEYSDVLLAKSGGEVDKEIYRFIKGDTDMCMRYDLTVPLARFVAMHKDELNFPFKRYQIGKVYRGERPQKGRFREFYQCDADIIGDESLSLIADAECVALFERCFDALGLDVVIEVSNRKIIAGLVEELGKSEIINDILIILDKLDKISVEDAIAELTALGVDVENSEKLIKLTKTTGKIDEICQKLRNFCKNDTFLLGVSELEEVDKYLKAFGAKSMIANLGVIRGHNYYTGTVFEGFLKNQHLAIGGGGRFENLCGYFTNKNMPGVGMSIGVTRLFDLLLQDGYFDKSKASEIDIAIITFDDTLDEGLKVMSELRQNGIKAECFYENKSFKSKMKEANKREVKYVLIIGEDEVKSKMFTLKDMDTSEQEKLSISGIVKKFKKLA